MIVPSVIERRYGEVVELVRAAGSQARDRLLAFCEPREYLFHGRVKSLESLAEKIESGRFARWADLDDLYACSVVVPLPSQRSEVADYVRSAFVIVKELRPGQVQKPPDAFRFDDWRFACRLRPPEGLPLGGSASVYDVLFEIQLKTTFAHAWGTATHALVYKTHDPDWRRYRLAAMMRAASEQLDMLVHGFETASGHVEGGEWPDVSDKKLIRDRLKALADEGLIPPESVPRDWSRLADNVYRAFQAYAGYPATGRSSSSLAIVAEALEVVEVRIRSIGPQSFPLSVSLYQFVVGALAVSGRFSGRAEGYSVLVTDAMNTVFPSITPPGRAFEVA